MPSKTSDMLAVSRTAGQLALGYYAFLVAQYVAANPQSINSLPPAEEFGRDPVGEIKRKDGTSHTLDLRFYLDLFREDHGIQSEILRSWAMGALLTLGDELSAHKYFDRAPILELVYHLRNGVAHGNRFNITRDGQHRLVQYPAHNRDATANSPAGVTYEITPGLGGAVLFDFMGPADVIDLLQSVELYLSKAAGGPHIDHRHCRDGLQHRDQLQQERRCRAFVSFDHVAAIWLHKDPVRGHASQIQGRERISCRQRL